VREGDYLTAICLKKYERTLKSAVDNGAILDRDRILDGIAAGLRHLHDKFGLVHNDINHANIMLDESSAPIIIDFDSCVPIGESFGSRKRTTYGWEPRPEPAVSSAESDLYALKLIAQYLDGKVVGDLPIHPEANTDVRFCSFDHNA
jgi:serine/threonine protein kinase